MEEGIEQEKPFDIVLIVFLMIVAVISDVSDILSDVLSLGTFGIPYVLNTFLISPISWAVIQGTFIMKLGFVGGAGSRVAAANITAALGGILNEANIPIFPETITTAIGIWMANHPKAAAVAAVAAGGAGALEAGVAEAGAAETAVAEASAAGKIVTEEEAIASGIPKENLGKITAEEGLGEAGATEKAAEETAEAPEVKMPEKIRGEALGEEPTPFEKMKKLTEELPPQEEKGEDEEEEEPEETV